MFIIDLVYVKPLEEVDANVEAHVVFLKEQYAKGFFIASGRKVPRTGGVILAKADSRSLLEEIIEKDPFKKSGVAEYHITEFIPSLVAEGLEGLQTK